jgi:hypothetical protein
LPNKALSGNEIKKLMATPSVKAATAIENRNKWPGEDNLKILAKAAKERRPFAMLIERDGFRRYSIRYTKHYGGAIYIKPDSKVIVDGEGSSAFVQTLSEFAPCGYFSLKRLDNALAGVGDE